MISYVLKHSINCLLPTKQRTKTEEGNSSTKAEIKRRSHNLMAKFAQKSLATTPTFYVTNVSHCIIYLYRHTYKVRHKPFETPCIQTHVLHVYVTLYAFPPRCVPRLPAAFSCLPRNRDIYAREQRGWKVQRAEARGAVARWWRGERGKTDGERRKRRIEGSWLGEQESEREVHGERRLIGGYEGERKKQGEK